MLQLISKDVKTYKDLYKRGLGRLIHSTRSWYLTAIVGHSLPMQMETTKRNVTKWTMEAIGRKPLITSIRTTIYSRQYGKAMLLGRII